MEIKVYYDLPVKRDVELYDVKVLPEYKIKI